MSVTVDIARMIVGIEQIRREKVTAFLSGTLKKAKMIIKLSIKAILSKPKLNYVF